MALMCYLPLLRYKKSHSSPRESRGAHDAQLFTNNREKLPTVLGHDISKQTANSPQISPEQTIAPQQEISKAPQQEHSIGLGIGL